MQITTLQDQHLIEGQISGETIAVALETLRRASAPLLAGQTLKPTVSANLFKPSPATATAFYWVGLATVALLALLSYQEMSAFETGQLLLKLGQIYWPGRTKLTEAELLLQTAVTACEMAQDWL